MRQFVISDIHGHYKELMALINKLVKEADFDPEVDQLITLGDHIDRGPDSNKVVQQLIDWTEQYPHWVFLYGNHEDLMLDALVYGGRIYHSYDLWYGQGGRETFYSYVPNELTDYEKAIIQVEDVIPQEHLEFLMALPRFYQNDNYIFVHGGLKPEKTVEETPTQDILWIRDEFIDSDFDWGKKVIFGHTADGRGNYNWKRFGMKYKPLEPIVRDNKIGIDTAICAPSRNKLTALELPAEKFYFQEAIKDGDKDE